MKINFYEPSPLPDDEDVFFPGQYDYDIYENLSKIEERLNDQEKGAKKAEIRTIIFFLIDLILVLCSLALSFFQYFF